MKYYFDGYKWAQNYETGYMRRLGKASFTVVGLQEMRKKLYPHKKGANTLNFKGYVISGQSGKVVAYVEGQKWFVRQGGKVLLKQFDDDGTFFHTREFSASAPYVQGIDFDNQYSV